MNNIGKEKFLDIKFNELDKIFLEYKKKDYMSLIIGHFNSVTELEEKDRKYIISHFYDDTAYHASFSILISILSEIDNDYSQSLKQLLFDFWEADCFDADFDTNAGLTLIDYKNGLLDADTAYKKYNSIKKSKLQKQIATLKKYEEVNEFIDLFRNKEKVFSLVNRFLKTLEIKPLSAFNEVELIQGARIAGLNIKCKAHMDELEHLFYTCEELAPVLSQMPDNIVKKNARR